MKLYWYPKTRAMRISWMLEELGRPYERVRIDITDADAKTDPEFRSASPMGKVPALVDGPVKLWDSGAICLYLADQYPDAGLGVPVGDPQRGTFLQWIMFTNSVVEPAMGERFHNREPNPGQNGFGSFDKMLATLRDGLKDGTWLFGDRFTAADVLIGSSIDFMDMFGILEHDEILHAYLARCRERPAYKRTLEIEQS